MVKPRAKRKEMTQGPSSQHRHTFTAWPGLAPCSCSSAGDGCIPSEQIAILTAVLNRHTGQERVRGLAAVLPIGDAWRGRTLHICRREGESII